ncbi:MAG: Roadblock/LC7 family protein [Ilumatobacteraceae bacterium]|nr:Roadblock/LC7 family protein [Ilumatobacteraceae bacterium]
MIDSNPDVTSHSLAALVHERLDPQAILNALVRSVAGVIGAAIATPDGRSVAHSDQLTHDAGRAAMIAATMGLAAQLVGAVGGSQVEEVVVRSEAGYVVVCAIGDEGVLTVLARPNTNLHHITTEVRARRESLRSAVSGGA